MIEMSCLISKIRDGFFKKMGVDAVGRVVVGAKVSSKKMTERTRLAGWGFAGLMLALSLWASPMSAQENDLTYAEQISELGSARSVVRSDGRVRGRLTVRDAEFVFTQSDGGMIRVRDDITGMTHAFVPVISDRTDTGGAQAVTFHQYQITRHKSGAGEVIKALEDGSFQVGLDPSLSSTFYALVGGYTIELLGVASPRQVQGDISVSPTGESGECCISCGGATVCGCVVEACGGSCCSGECCGGSGPNLDVRF